MKSQATAYLFLAVLMCLVASDKPKLVKTKINDDLTVLVPKGWIAMDAMDFTQRYPSVRAPLAAYTNEDRTVDFSINVSATQWPDADLEMSQKFFKASLFNMFDRVDMIKEGVRVVNKHNFVSFEFESRINGNRQEQSMKEPILRYTYIQYLVTPSRTLVFSFTCPKRMKEEWQESAHEIMDNIHVKSPGDGPSKNK